MKKPEILQVGPYPESDQERLDARFTMHRYFDADDKTAFLNDVAPGIRGIATRGELGASRQIIEALPNLEVISVYGVGYDAVDLDAAKERNVGVSNTPNVLTGDVADMAVAMMLAQARGMIGADAWVRSGNWASKGFYGTRARAFGKRVGILGLGRIGYAVAKRLAAFDMDIAYTSTGEKDLAESWTYCADTRSLAERSDFLFVTLAASAETRHIVNQEVIEALGPDGILINVSRAANVDEEALLSALEKGTLGAAALDVFEGEPKINPRFLTLDNILLQPHIGSATPETRRAMGDLMYENLVAHFEGGDLVTPIL